MGIFWYMSVGLTVLGPCNCGGFFCARGGRINAEAFLIEELLEGGAWQWYGKRVRRAAERIPVLRGQCKKLI